MDKFLLFTICLTTLVGFTMTDDGSEILYEPFSVMSFTMPESCKNKKVEYCFDNTDYPLEIIEDLLKDMPDMEVSSEGEVDLFRPYGQRQGTPDEPDCRAQATTDPIYYIVDEDGRDRVVIQLEGKFLQRYSVMWCDKEGRITSRTQHFLESTVMGHNMTCENKYMHYDFLVLSLKPDILGEWKMERARTKTGIPVCCVCRY